MSAIDTACLSVDQLAGMLRAWSEGDYAGEAGTELLIAHRTWLARPDFRRQLLTAVDDGWARGGTTVPMAIIDWEQIGGFLQTAGAAGSERRVLLIAASLAGHNHGGSWAELLSGLDQVNVRLVLDAVAHACGWHEHGITAHIGGHVAAGA